MGYGTLKWNWYAKNEYLLNDMGVSIEQYWPDTPVCKCVSVERVEKICLI